MIMMRSRERRDEKKRGRDCQKEGDLYRPSIKIIDSTLSPKHFALSFLQHLFPL